MLPFISGQGQLRFQRLLVVIKQTAYEEYSQLKLRGQAPKALRWKRLENRYKSHKKCVNDLLSVLRHHNISFNCVNRAEMDRQHLADVDLVVAVGGDGTVLSAAHFLDHGTIPLLGVNSDPISLEDTASVKKKSDERRSHGALCMCTSQNMHKELPRVFYGDVDPKTRNRIQCIVKSTFSETRVVPALNDLLICNPSPGSVSRFRMGWLTPAEITTDENSTEQQLSNNINTTQSAALNNGNSDNTSHFFPSSFSETGLRFNVPMPKYATSLPYGTVTRFGGVPFDVTKSLNVWSSGMWICTSTGSTAAMHAAGGQPMHIDSPDLQYLIREHMVESDADRDVIEMNNKMLNDTEQLHIRWNSQKGRIYIDGSHLIHDLELGDEILINNKAPSLELFLSSEGITPRAGINSR